MPCKTPATIALAIVASSAHGGIGAPLLSSSPSPAADAWIDAEQSRTEGGATDGKKAIGVPEFTANLAAEADLAMVPGLTLTARVTHTGSAYVDLGNTQRVPAWNRLDAGARYKTRWGDRGVTVRAGVDNVLDKTFWTIGGRNFIQVAPPRTWRLSASLDF